jgi:three-Cys-motif partner protein
LVEPDHYVGREQTLVKHIILQKYLERFAHIIGSRWSTINYIDCFSGPWNVHSQNLEDSSFYIAISELRKAQEAHAKRGRKILIRGFFLEKDSAAYQRLQGYAGKNSAPNVEIVTKHEELADASGAIQAFVKAGGRDAFTFLFIDPTGWTGFEMDVIRPLLQLQPSEVVINFMTEHIRRFINTLPPAIQITFDRMFGSNGYREYIRANSDEDRDDLLVRLYSERLRQIGSFPYVCNAIVLHPGKDRSYFHLIYCTRDLKGVEVFKDAEKRGMAAMQKARAGAKARRRVETTHTYNLFSAEQLSSSDFYDGLVARYKLTVRENVLALLKKEQRVEYDQAWEEALKSPLVSERDLKEWIRDWRKEGLTIEGFERAQRVPRLKSKNFLIWHEIGGNA